ncbi:coatamer subunit protein [Niveomyces insectorum RCEF 264]|uniref:Coatomer subunit epsilon n=1 Tax=Niveomyces insectorum RCEF 264 TaxID=1081102 RepID=A0A167LIC2_9HYPO|nr:coatamer subunit protein [Niveomyces insectorum RCEF 264]
MDPYSAEGELINIHDHFHQGQFQIVANYDTSTLSPENALAARVLQLRARIELGDAEGVISQLRNESDPALQVVEALANYRTGRTETALNATRKLVVSAGRNTTVQIIGGIILQACGKSEEALALLSQHDSNLDAVALIVNIHLQQNRNELALKEVAAARRWAQDSLLVNLAESWVGMRRGGDGYQQAFYVYEELAQAPSSSSGRSSLAQAISELHLGRIEEAQSALEQTLKETPEYADVFANLLVLTILAGKNQTDVMKYALQRTQYTSKGR